MPSSPVASAKRFNLFGWLAWLVLLALVAKFLVSTLPRYFVLTPKSYGDYFWPKVSWLLPHLICGLVAVIIGPMQFWPSMRSKYLAYHRIAGRLYVIAVLFGTIAAFGLAWKIDRLTTAYSLGLLGLAIAWITTTSMAFVAIRKRNVVQHRQWMVRSYVMTFAFVTFRLLSEVLNAGNILPENERLGVVAWSCWAIPLLFAEVAIQWRSTFKANA